MLVVVSVHHGNTRKIAERMAKELGAQLVEPEEINPSEILTYDLLGLGSGIFFGRFHKRILKFVDNLPPGRGKKAFVFSTSGLGQSSYNEPLRVILREKGFEVVGSFTCRGYDTFSLLKVFGGINRGRPNEEDLRASSVFAAQLKEGIKS
ncbi:MAG: flavodoxin family protein [Atribacterota bacterium]